MKALVNVGEDVVSVDYATGRDGVWSHCQAYPVRSQAVVEYNRFGARHVPVDQVFPSRCSRTREWKRVVNLFGKDQ